ncbi:helix-turn-helix domain-containing protein [Altererythrobacter sp. BO-6]|nr:helix-turn-helix domain-containing protein [Altererythrobacter sp. BO-6]
MSIKAHLDPTSTSADMRSAERRQLYLETSGGLPGGEEANVAIHNISAGGMLIETDLDLRPGLEIQVDLPHEPSVPAEIVWSSGRYFGCRFNRPIGSAALSAVQLKAEGPLPSELRQSIPARGQGLAFGKMLEQQRKARGLTLEQVASRLGVSKPTVWAWEKGKARPLDDRYPAIAEVLGLSVSDLHERDQPAAVSELLKSSRAEIARALGIAPESVRILIEI